jgi:peptide/nickel transport system permease protein|tara:strand:- start:173 stop:1012 length:840 start_codon:yes stop_codon:yes gene_type:complete
MLSHRNKRLIRKFTRKRIIIYGTVLAVLVVLSFFAPYFAPYDPIQISMEGRKSPNVDHIFGTDRLGRDILSRIIYGTKYSLSIGIISVSIGLVFGTTMGVLSAYYGGLVDTIIMRFIDALLAFPGILLALVVIAVLGPGLFNVMLAVGISTVPEYARLARGKVLSVMQLEYIEAVHSIGGSNIRVILKHILPNISAPITILATLQVGNAILVGSGLSFLGMGAQPPTPEWGLMTAEGRNFMSQAWWISTFPGIAILITVISINQFGDGLREAIDPYLKE